MRPTHPRPVFLRAPCFRGAAPDALPSRVDRWPTVATGLATILLAVVLPAALAAQEPPEPIPLSQLGRVVQRLGPAEISVEYRRPVARDREIFGALVPFDEVWTPAADSAAVLTLSHDLLVAGEPVAAGDYSIWMIPRGGGADWTVILSEAARVFHAPYPEGRDAYRFAVAPVADPGHMETLAFTFPEVNGPRALLRFHWGRGAVELPLVLPGR